MRRVRYSNPDLVRIIPVARACSFAKCILIFRIVINDTCHAVPRILIEVIYPINDFVAEKSRVMNELVFTKFIPVCHCSFSKGYNTLQQLGSQATIII